MLKIKKFKINKNTKMVELYYETIRIILIIKRNYRNDGVVIQFATVSYNNGIEVLNKNKLKNLIPILKKYNKDIPYYTNWQYLIHQYNILCGTDKLEYETKFTEEVFLASCSGYYIPPYAIIPIG